MLNHITIMGRLTRDPELRRTGSGTAVASFTLAVDRDFTDKQSGEKETDFIECVAWRQTGEFISRYFRKGQNIGLNGTIQTRQYQDKDTGKNRTAFEVIINNAYFVESKNSSNGQAQTQPQTQQTPSPSIGYGNELDDFSQIASEDGDLPF